MAKTPNKTLLCLTITAVLTLIFLTVAAANLANYLPVAADDGWLMSTSYKLASQGVLGSDLYRGFFNAEKHYLINLPVHHFFQAASFKLFGIGIAQSRLPGLLSAILLIWTASSLARRHYGLVTAVLTAAFLIFWRSNLTATEPRIPLLPYAQSGRYDITAAALVWSAVWLLDELLRRPHPLKAAALGILCGLSTLTQYFGGFVLLPVAIALWRQWGRNTFRQRTPYLIAAGFLLILLPYAAFILTNLADFMGQASIVRDRVQFLKPTFYMENILGEPRRFAHLFPQQQDSLISSITPIGPWLLMLTLAAAVFYLLRTLLSGKIKTLPLPWLSALCFALGLTLFDHVKAPVYAILLLPGICMALAALTAAVLHRLQKLNRPPAIRLAAILPVLALLTALILEGANSHRHQLRQARQVTPYLHLTSQIEAALSPNAVILGSERWWPALPSHPYYSLNSLWAQWRLDDQDGRSPQFSDQVQATAADFIIVNNNVRGDLEQHPEQMQKQFWDYLAACSALVADWTDMSYGRIEIYSLTDEPDCQ